MKILLKDGSFYLGKKGWVRERSRGRSFESAADAINYAVREGLNAKVMYAFEDPTYDFVCSGTTIPADDSQRYQRRKGEDLRGYTKALKAGMNLNMMQMRALLLRVEDLHVKAEVAREDLARRMVRHGARPHA